MTNYNDGLWYGHNGGECPVHPETVVEVAFLTIAGSFLDDNGQVAANIIAWDGNDVGRPVAFRVIKEHKEPREFWCVMSHMFGSEDKAKTFLDELNEEHPGMNFGKVFHVREVLE